MRELLFLIVLVLGVAVGFAGCGDDEDKTEGPAELTVDAGGAMPESDAGGTDASGEESTGGTGGESESGAAGEEAGGSESE